MEENTADKILDGDSAPPMVEETATPEQPVQPQEEEKESRYQKRIDQLTKARREAEERARMAEERARLYEMQRFQSQPPQQPKDDDSMVGEMTREKWQEWHADDPVAATRYVSRLEAKKVADEKAQEVVSGINRAQMVQQTIESVYKDHPELKDVMEGRKSPDEVPFWQVYDEVAREMPDAKYLVKGPYIVMKEAERRVKERELDEKTKKISEEAVLKEKEREKQVAAGLTAGSSPRPSSAPTAKLTPEEEKIARKMGMSPEEYAKNKKAK